MVISNSNPDSCYRNSVCTTMQMSNVVYRQRTYLFRFRNSSLKTSQNRLNSLVPKVNFPRTLRGSVRFDSESIDLNFFSASLTRFSCSLNCFNSASVAPHCIFFFCTNECVRAASLLNPGDRINYHQL